MPSTDAAPPATGSTPTQSEYWTDEKLLAQGWTQQQVDIWKAEQAEGGAAASSGDEVPEMEMSSAEASGLPGNHPAAKYKFSNSVLEGVMEKFGITDPVHRRYNVLAWVRGYYQDRGENHGYRYEALKKAQQRLSEILEVRGIG